MKLRNQSCQLILGHYKAFDDAKAEMEKDVASYIKDQIKNAFKGNKHIKIK